MLSRHNTSYSGANIDLWKYKLDVNDPDWERITWFNEGMVFNASNPVVRDDGKYIALQVAGNHEAASIGHSIDILDLEKREDALNKTKKKK